MANKDIVIHDDLIIPWKEIEIYHAKSGGPGGQNVNKVNTKVQLKWLLSVNEEIAEDARNRIIEVASSYSTKSGDIMVSSTKFRNQKQNLQECLDHLIALLEESCKVPTVRKKKKMPRKIKEQRLKNKKFKAEKKKLRAKISTNY